MVQVWIRPCTDIASNLHVIDLKLNAQMACGGLQQKFQHAEYFTCNPFISQSILNQFSPLISGYHKLSFDSPYNMMQLLLLVAITSKSSQVNHCGCTIARTGYVRCCKKSAKSYAQSSAMSKSIYTHLSGALSKKVGKL